MDNQMKMIPYGMSDFPAVIRNNYYYVDKTRFIELMERQPRYLFLIRPRRFGKSLFLAMLECYYDCLLADKFNELFGQLYIGQHPTPLHNKYLILRFNFSEINANPELMETSFASHCRRRMMAFIDRYEAILGPEIREDVRPGIACGRYVGRYRRLCGRTSRLPAHLPADR